MLANMEITQSTGFRRFYFICSLHASKEKPTYFKGVNGTKLRPQRQGSSPRFRSRWESAGSLGGPA